MKIIKKENVLLQELKAISDTHGGVLNPRDVLEAARPIDSALHPYFEWDDALAGEAMRLIQAGALIRRVRLKIVKEEKDGREVRIEVTRAFESLPSMRKSGGGYLPLETIVDDAVKRQELLDSVEAQLIALKKKYQGLAELESVWEAIDALVVEDDAPVEMLPAC
jgi:hypothetical protein